jgi:putative hydrolase
MLSDLLRLLRSEGPLQWDLAFQLAQSVASEGVSDANVEPIARIRLEELVRLADLAVADVTGMTTTASGRPVGALALSAPAWARRSLERWRSLIEKVAAALAPLPPPSEGQGPVEPSGGGDLSALLGQWTTAVAPAMTALQIGSVVGHLARRTLGQYDLPLPRPDDDELAVVTANIHRFAEDWSLPADEVTLWLALRDVATHAVLSRKHVAGRLEQLLVEHASGLRPDLTHLEERLGELATGHLADLGDLSRLLGDPSALVEVQQTDELSRTRAQLEALGAVLGGYVEWVTDTAARRLVSARSTIREAMRRRRVERGAEERVAEALFGLRLDQDQLDRGEAFVRGVLERGGQRELARLWVSAASLPTPAEVDAPGLWIERVNLPFDELRTEQGSPPQEGPGPTRG